MADPPRHETFVEKQIRLAQERGDFDDLPGKGAPLRLGDPNDELWWVRHYVEREGLSTEALLPPSIQLRKELDRLPETLRALPTEEAVRDAVRALNLRVVDHLRMPVGPQVPIGRVDVEAAVQRWRADRPAPRPLRPDPPAAPPRRRRRRLRWSARPAR